MFILLKRLSNYLKKNQKIFFIDKPLEFSNLEEQLIKEDLIGVDTEFDWRNTYFPNLSLLQISTKSKIFLIDCLKIKDLSRLQNIFDNLESTIIFHSVRSDATVLFSSANLEVKNVFDIQIAEQVISNKNPQNYANLVKKYFSIHLDKSETNSNWLKRPFSKNQLDYAANDVKYLIGIFKKQKKILLNLKKYESVINSSLEEAKLGNRELYISRLKKIDSSIKNAQRLFLWRENMAIEKNVPPSYIFKDKHLNKILNFLDKEQSEDKIYDLVGNLKLSKNLVEFFKK
ncbi:MAG: hypothetical protein CMG07_03335 [Candidatus Marinimicrobia bacterium]|nr:hypothetical protein [Candidatus Neomarinimicrobiota bacterium]